MITIGSANGRPYQLGLPDLMASMLFLGTSGSGKTTLLTKLLTVLLDPCANPRTSVVILDGVGELTARLPALYFETLDTVARTARLPRATRDRLEQRLQLLPIATLEDTGVSINILELAARLDVFRRLRPEHPLERAAVGLEILNLLRAEAKEMAYVNKVAPAAFATLAAAHRPITQLVTLLRQTNLKTAPYIRGLLDDIERFGHLRHWKGQTLLEELRVLLPIEDAGGALTLTGPHRDTHIGSTERNFDWTWRLDHLFDRTRLGPYPTYGAFFDAGGVLLVPSYNAASTMLEKLRAVFAALWVDRAIERHVGPDTPPSYLVVDEQHAMPYDQLQNHLARARNSRAFFWLSAQNIEQFGPAAPTVLNSVHRKVFFAIESEATWRYLGYKLGRTRLDRTRLEVSAAIGTSDVFTDTEGGNASTGSPLSPGWLPMPQTERQETSDALTGDTTVKYITRYKPDALEPAGDSREGSSWGTAHAHGTTRTITKKRAYISASDQVREVEELVATLRPRHAVHITPSGAALVITGTFRQPTSAAIRAATARFATRVVPRPAFDPPPLALRFPEEKKKQEQAAQAADPLVAVGETQPTPAQPQVPNPKGFTTQRHGRTEKRPTVDNPTTRRP